MTDSKVIMFPETGTSGSSNSIDPAVLMTMMNNGGFNNGGFMWIIFLFFLYPLFRNGNLFGSDGSGSNGLTNMLNNDTGRQWLMDAVNGNRDAVNNLANMFNTTAGNIQTAISQVAGNVTSVGNQVGLTGQQVINAIQQGNMSLAQQLCTCCCENKQLVTTMGYEGQLRDQTNTAAIQTRIDQLANGVQTGFASTAYETQAQTNSLNSALQSQTQTIIDKLATMEANAQQDKINSLTAQLTAANSRAERAAELAPILNQLNAIKAGQPATTTVQYPQLTVLPTQLYNYMYNGGGTGFWN